MKKLIISVLILALLLPAAALADLPNIFSGMSFEDLVKLREQLNLAIWNSQEWQEVTVPVGVWEVGKDIPAGTWTIKSAAKGEYGESMIIYCDKLKDSGLECDPWNATVYQSKEILGAENEEDNYPPSVDITIADGMYLEILFGPVIFTPYTGKPDLGFK